MQSKLNKFFIACLSLTLAGCAGVGGGATTVSPKFDKNGELAAERKLHDELAVEEILRGIDQLYQLSFPISSAAIFVCDDRTTPDIGAKLLTYQMIPEHLYETATESLGLNGQNIIISSIAKGSPAAIAGLEQLDKIIEVNGVEFKTDNPKLRQFQLNPVGQSNQLIIERDGATLEFQVNSRGTCDYPVHLSYDGEINAFADGEAIYVNSGLISHLDDNHVKNIIAHEFAHNTQKHIEKQRVNAVPGVLLDFLFDRTTGLQTSFTQLSLLQFSEEFEQEADYIGLYIMANAGLEIDDAQNVWRRLTLLDPTQDNRSSDLLKTHPTNPERYLALRATITEIQQKQANGEPLLPNFKK